MAVYRGVVKQNVIVLPEDVHLPDGLIVEVRLRKANEIQPATSPSKTSSSLPKWGGICADLGQAPSTEEIDAARQEEWANFRVRT
jgi:hypothetical protein